VRQIKIVLILFLFSFLVFGKASAGTGDNVFGWAWSENVGWISFNCYNDYNGDGVLEDHCANSNYGVNLDFSTGLLSGYAWAGGGEAGDNATATIGWISFNTSSLVGCPDGNCFARVNTTTGEVSGWARACSVFQSGCSGATSTNTGGWDGWIKLRGTTTGGTPYGVTLNLSTREFEGWAAGWDDSTSTAVIGWISFNCKNQNVCSNSNYKVFLINQPPTVSNPYETQNCCAWGFFPQVAKGLAITLHWTYSDPDGDPRSAFEIWLDDSASFSDPKFNKVFNISSSESSQSYVLNLLDDQEGDWLNRLAWGTTYYWKVRVKDSAGNWSDWSQVDSFTTPSHAYPYVDFTWSPQRPTVNQVVQFINLSECYNPSDNIIPCSSWYWTFQDGNPSFSTNQNPTTTFSSTGQKEVTLRVTDFSGYSCINSKVLQATYPLPFFKEIPPIFFKMREFLASLISAVSKIKLF
jgi:hypothetical protein